MILENPSVSGRDKFDICIIGSGPAGGTVANELAGSGLKVCVLESGKRKPTPFGDALRAVDSEGIEIKPYSRERVFGGASTTWAGLSSPFDEIDFEGRDWIEHSGWPISRDVLLIYYDRATKYRFPPIDWFQTSHWKSVSEAGDFQPAWDELEEKVFLACAEAQNFGHEFTDVYERADVDLILDATVVHLDGKPGTKEATHAIVRSSDGSQYRIAASTFVLAANGIENCRLLLNSTFSCDAGLGNERDQVGRYFMNHPKDYCGTIRLRRPIRELPAYFGFMYRSYAGYFGLRLPESVQREKRLLNSYIRFQPLFAWSDNPGVEAFVYLTKQLKLVMRAFRRAKKNKVVSIRDYSETGDDSDLQNERKGLADYVRLAASVAVHMPGIASYVFFRLVDRADPKIRAIRIRNFLEMEPDPENRVTLSDEKDAFGERIPRVTHRTTALDRRTLIEIHHALNRELTTAAWGEFESPLQSTEDPWPIHLDASHHMGGTRMGTDPTTSVVDPDCRIHGCPNVYVAGGSVFPTCGNANPTFTVVALAIRLAERLRLAVYQLRASGILSGQSS